jgi:hypothetical protein
LRVQAGSLKLFATLIQAIAGAINSTCLTVASNEPLAFESPTGGLCGNWFEAVRYLEVVNSQLPTSDHAQVWGPANASADLTIAASMLIFVSLSIGSFVRL